MGSQPGDCIWHFKSSLWCLHRLAGTHIAQEVAALKFHWNVWILTHEYHWMLTSVSPTWVELSKVAPKKETSIKSDICMTPCTVPNIIIELSIPCRGATHLASSTHLFVQVLFNNTRNISPHLTIDWKKSNTIQKSQSQYHQAIFSTRW